MFMDLSPQSIQKMMLTPKMLLSMHVLQLNIMDLRTFMRAELEENPLLEEETQDETPDDDETKLDDEISRLVDEDIEDDISLALNNGHYEADEEKRQYFESLITKNESLQEHLLWQLEVLAKNDEDKRIGECIIGNLDEDGFLNTGLEQMRALANADIESFKSALRLVRSFDPLGVAARNLQESLLIQLISSGKADTHLYRIAYTHLEDLEKGHYEKIANALSIPVSEVQRAKQRISYLNPKPAANFGVQESGMIIEPDVFFDKDNGTYSIEVSERNLPKLKINRYYKSILKDELSPQATKEFIMKKYSNAAWFIGALSQRRKTIGRVCEYLVDAQKDFLDKGDEAIKPLTLAQVAGPLSVSEATVSRVVSNKYAQVSNRLLPLKTFFSGYLKTKDGASISGRIVKQEIQNLIETEHINKPLSDERIAVILNKKGIKISRRTVSKYRVSLGILPYHLRKKMER